MNGLSILASWVVVGTIIYLAVCLCIWLQGRHERRVQEQAYQQAVQARLQACVRGPVDLEG